MNEVLLDSYTYHQAEAFAKLNNIDVAEVVKTSVLNFLGKFKRTKTVAASQKYELPEHLKKMRGVLAGVGDKNDEKLNYLLEKYICQCHQCGLFSCSICFISPCKGF